jgi:hypothetical protein
LGTNCMERSVNFHSAKHLDDANENLTAKKHVFIEF